MFKTLIRDWWRGFTDEELRSVREKMAQQLPPGSIVPVTRGELNALLAERGDE